MNLKCILIREVGYRECLDEFSSWGFQDPSVFFVKSDFFPIQNSKKIGRPQLNCV